MSNMAIDFAGIAVYAHVVLRGVWVACNVITARLQTSRRSLKVFCLYSVLFQWLVMDLNVFKKRRAGVWHTAVDYVPEF